MCLKVHPDDTKRNDLSHPSEGMESVSNEIIVDQLHIKNISLLV